MDPRLLNLHQPTLAGLSYRKYRIPETPLTSVHKTGQRKTYIPTQEPLFLTLVGSRPVQRYLVSLYPWSHGTDTTVGTGKGPTLLTRYFSFDRSKVLFRRGQEKTKTVDLLYSGKSPQGKISTKSLGVSDRSRMRFLVPTTDVDSHTHSLLPLDFRSFT